MDLRLFFFGEVLIQGVGSQRWNEGNLGKYYFNLDPLSKGSSPNFASNITLRAETFAGTNFRASKKPAKFME